MKDSIITEINNMLPSELESAKVLIDEILNKKKNDKFTNQEYIKRFKSITCPSCESKNIKKNGHKDGTQRYLCKDCKASFVITKNTVLYHTTINYTQLKTILYGMYDYKPIVDISKEANLTPTAVYTTEVKIFSALDQLQKDIILNGVIEVDEKYIRISFKGTRHNKMPRESRKNGFQDRTAGISKEQVCVIVAIDSTDQIIIKVVGNGPATTNMISTALKGKISEGSILVTDSKNSYIKFAEDNKLVLKQIPTGKHKIECYTLGEVNQLIGEIEDYLSVKKGISTRHLQHHMNFVRYRKNIKYAIDYLEINNEMFKETLLLDISLSNKTVYSTEMPIDVRELYGIDFK